MKNILNISGKAISVKGNDIDTDRIIPARFLKCVSFAELGPHAFEDDRKADSTKGITHSFDQTKFQEANILFVNQNFGCGSSREHAPQSLMRWGIQAIIGESFAEIFYANCISLGIPCVVLNKANINKIMKANQQDPNAQWTLDIENQKFSGPIELSVEINPNSQEQFITGKWNPLVELLDNLTLVRETAKKIPYLS